MVVESADGATNTDDADDGRVTLAADDAAAARRPGTGGAAGAGPRSTCA